VNGYANHIADANAQKGENVRAIGGWTTVTSNKLANRENGQGEGPKPPHLF
jgi:hypothetical protein